MWEKLPADQKSEYKRMLLAFASLTDLFAQKADNEAEQGRILTPVINSKYQETIFQRVFHANAEDIGNTSYDASLRCFDSNGREVKCLVGIKTFGLGSGSQKVAQFKANNSEWADLIKQIVDNAFDEQGKQKSKELINIDNQNLYYKLALRICKLRNARIESSLRNLQGFDVSNNDEAVQSVYHVLMTAIDDNQGVIYVGETSYDEIDLKNINILGCTKASNPANFAFSDGRHTYKFTSADSQLYMDFNNKDIIVEKWNVKYARDAYAIFSELANKFYGESFEDKKYNSNDDITESYSWFITNNKGEVEKFSGYNSFYGVGSKLSKESRKGRIDGIKQKYSKEIRYDDLTRVTRDLKYILLESSGGVEEKERKVRLRDRLANFIISLENEDLKEDVFKLIYRPQNELYIPIPNAKSFHTAHPDFFAPGAGLFIEGSHKLAKESKDDRSFNLVFEPSGDSIHSYITQDDGKAIESRQKQSILGEWILRGVFQLEPYEPLTSAALNKVGINGVRLYKKASSDDVHLSFIWIDKESLPEDFIGNGLI